MKIINSYKVKIINVNNALNDTIDIYRKALAFYIDVINKEWDHFDGLQSKSQVNIAEKLLIQLTITLTLNIILEVYFTNIQAI